MEDSSKIGFSIKVGTVVYILMYLQSSAKRNTIGSTPRMYILGTN